VSNYLERFKSRRKVNKELVSQYEWDARFHGDKTIRSELAQARRTATSLKKASDAFRHLRPEHKLALDAAASAMKSLAVDLAELALWAKDYLAFCNIEREHERVEGLEKLAEKRWRSDESALKFERDLLHELQTKEGLLALADWFHGLGRHRDVDPETFSTDLNSLSYEPKGDSAQVATAALLQHIGQSHPYKHTGFQDKVYYTCGWTDYEEYISWRKSVASATSAALQGARRQISG
jgi:hypothetical protein